MQSLSHAKESWGIIGVHVPAGLKLEGSEGPRTAGKGSGRNSRHDGVKELKFQLPSDFHCLLRWQNQYSGLH